MTAQSREVQESPLLKLPPELLIEIIKNTVPGIECNSSSYDERLKQLECLCWTCMALYLSTLPVLYADVRVWGPEQLSQLDRALENDALATTAKNSIKRIQMNVIKMWTGEPGFIMAARVFDLLIGGGLREVSLNHCDTDEALLNKVTLIKTLTLNEVRVNDSDGGGSPLRFPALTKLKIVSVVDRVCSPIERLINAKSFPKLTGLCYINFNAKKKLQDSAIRKFHALAPQLEHLKLNGSAALDIASDPAFWRSAIKLRTFKMPVLMSNDSGSSPVRSDQRLRCALKHLDHSFEQLTIIVYYGDVHDLTAMLEEAFLRGWVSVARLKNFHVRVVGRDDAENERAAKAAVDEVVAIAKKFKIELNK